MNREVHVRFWERAEVQSLRATRHQQNRLLRVFCPQFLEKADLTRPPPTPPGTTAALASGRVSATPPRSPGARGHQPARWRGARWPAVSTREADAASPFGP
jgi:hypothetical protein